MLKENNISDIKSRLQEINRLSKECLILYELAPEKSKLIKKNAPEKSSSLDFNLPIRPFIKKYSQGMSGPKKFTLLVAYLTKADEKKTITLEEVKESWHRMEGKSLLGMEFNRFYSGAAKDNDWVHASSTATYSVRPSWKKILL